jgi:hypothetical protein
MERVMDLEKHILVNEDDEYLCLMTFDEFTEAVEMGMFTDYDGSGAPFLDFQGFKYWNVHFTVQPSTWTPEFRKDLENSGYIGINWFNK